MDSPPSRRRAAFTNFGHGLLAGVLIAFVHLSGLALTLDKRNYDLWFQLSPTSYRPVEHVALVAVDDKSLQDRDLGVWPWPSQRVATLLRRIDEAGPAAIGLDLALDRYRDRTDPDLARALSELPRVVVTANLRRDPTPSAPAEIDWPLRSFAAPERAGFSNALADRTDGYIRSWRLAILSDGETIVSFPLLLALTASGERPAAIRLKGSSVFVPQRGTRGSWWPAVTAIDYRRPSSLPTFSASDVLAGRVSPQMLEGKVVLVGGTARGEFADIFQTPLSGDLLAEQTRPTHGAEILAYSVETLLAGIRVREAAPVAVAAAAVLFTILTCAALRPLRPVWGFALAIALALGAAVSCLWLFASSYLQLAATPFVLGAATSYVVVVLEKRAAAEAARALVERRNALLRDLSAMVTHDLKGPLTSVTGFLSLLAEEPLTTEQQEYVQIALGSSRWLSVLVTGILDVARMEAGQLVLAREPLDLGRELEQSLLAVRYQLQGKDLKTEVVVAPDLPPVSADAEYFRRIIVNLVGNAAKFAPADSTIHLRARRDDTGDAVVVSVEDEGPGISREHQDRIFDKFVQVAKGKSAEQVSVGLGLAFCRLAVEAHGGRIWVESEPGEGACFSFSLPTAGPPQPLVADAGTTEATP